MKDSGYSLEQSSSAIRILAVGTELKGFFYTKSELAEAAAVLSTPSPPTLQH
jgi:hypothetical protein